MAGLLDFAQMAQRLGLLGNAAYDPITNKNKGMNPLATTEGARPYYGEGATRGGSAPLNYNNIMPAMRFQDGHMLVAPKRGMIHADLYEMGAGQMAKRGPMTGGFVDTSTGKFYNHSEIYGKGR
jgi:hypothetical protein